jgi:hypothetical protein
MITPSMCPISSVAWRTSPVTWANTTLDAGLGTYAKYPLFSGILRSAPLRGFAALNWAGVTSCGQGSTSRFKQWPWYLGSRYQRGSISPDGQSARLCESDRIVRPFRGVCSFGSTRARDGWMRLHKLPPFRTTSNKLASTSNGFPSEASAEGMPTPSDASSAAAHSCSKAWQRSSWAPTAETSSFRYLTAHSHHRLTSVGTGSFAIAVSLHLCPTSLMKEFHSDLVKR